jgi:hypothetical protein
MGANMLQRIRANFLETRHLDVTKESLESSERPGYITVMVNLFWMYVLVLVLAAIAQFLGVLDWKRYPIQSGAAVTVGQVFRVANCSDLAYLVVTRIDWDDTVWVRSQSAYERLKDRFGW